MDYRKLAQKHIESALTLGYITLEDGETLSLKAHEVLGIARYVLKEGLGEAEEVFLPSTMPTELCDPFAELLSAHDEDEDA
jgi:hypothetical protein